MLAATALRPSHDVAGDLFEEITEQRNTRRLAKYTYIPSFSSAICAM